jgi:hypothetical protein
MENELALREGFLSALVLSTLSVIRSTLHAHIYILSEGQAGKAWGPENKAMLIRKLDGIEWKSHLTPFPLPTLNS